LFEAFGHDHLVTAKEFSGRVIFDPNRPENSSVTFRVATKSLTALDPGESEKNRSSVQTTMQGKELDVGQFPYVTFSSTDVSKLAKKGEKWNVTLAGKLKLHGVDKTIHLPVTVGIAGNELIAPRELFLLQTDYGITPVKVAGGTVKVKDRLRIHFEMHAPVKN
jgi:polyisoprenoid-binding protein YceI